MRKPQKPFTFEVKRSRLPSREPSAFQRYVVEIDRIPINKPPALVELSAARANEASHRPRRVLPDLSGETKRSVPVTPLPCQGAERIHAHEDHEEPASVLPLASASQSRSPGEPSGLVVSPARRVRPRARTVQDLPPGQRWKRRLPKAAW